MFVYKMDLLVDGKYDTSFITNIIVHFFFSQKDESGTQFSSLVYF